MDASSRKRGYDAEPAAVLEAAISALQESAGEAPRSGPPFVASATFSGRRPGYYFGTSKQGTG